MGKMNELFSRSVVSSVMLLVVHLESLSSYYHSSKFLSALSSLSSVPVLYVPVASIRTHLIGSSKTGFLIIFIIFFIMPSIYKFASSFVEVCGCYLISWKGSNDIHQNGSHAVFGLVYCDHLFQRIDVVLFA